MLLGILTSLTPITLQMVVTGVWAALSQPSSPAHLNDPSYLRQPVLFKE